MTENQEWLQYDFIAYSELGQGGVALGGIAVPLRSSSERRSVWRAKRMQQIAAKPTVWQLPLQVAAPMPASRSGTKRWPGLKVNQGPGDL